MRRISNLKFPISALLIFIVGCTSSIKSQQPILASASDSEKGAAQLWEENCNRCHNYRPASSYNDYQWTVVMHHMRVRARLTPEEHKAILEFLKSAN